MRNEYEMITVTNYLRNEIEYTSITEQEIEREITRYLLNKENQTETLAEFLSA